MSFDMIIRFDKAYSKSVALEPLSMFLSSLPDVRTVRKELLVYEIPPDRHMEISLESALSCGDSDAPSEANRWRVNCIRLHIPYAFVGEPGCAAENAYYNLAFKITTLLGWKLYDQQMGKYVRIHPCSYSDQKAFDRLVLGVSEPSDTGSAVGPTAKSQKRGGTSSTPKQRKKSGGKKKSTSRNKRDS